MNFGEALELLKSGERVARAGWNGKGMFLYLADGSNTLTQPFICMRTATGQLVPWTASQTDLLAEDWEKVS